MLFGVLGAPGGQVLCSPRCAAPLKLLPLPAVELDLDVLSSSSTGGVLWPPSNSAGGSSVTKSLPEASCQRPARHRCCQRPACGRHRCCQRPSLRGCAAAPLCRQRPACPRRCPLCRQSRQRAPRGHVAFRPGVAALVGENAELTIEVVHRTEGMHLAVVEKTSRPFPTRWPSAHNVRRQRPA